MGDIQNENRDNAKTTFDIVNNASVINILTTLFALIDEFVIEELEWAFSYNLFGSLALCFSLDFLIKKR